MKEALSLIFDRYTLALLGTVVLASLLPCRGQVAEVFGTVTTAAIALLFFLHGAKLSRDAVIAGLLNWRLHLLVLACTFVLFPLLGLATRSLAAQVVGTQLALGVLFLCTLPSTVQSSIAFTSIARGNVPAAVCAASASSLLGIFITPLLVGLLVHAGGGKAGPAPMAAIQGVVLQLFVPFVAGQVARRWIGGLVDRNKKVIGLVDRGSILLVVYTAFSAAVVAGLWKDVSAQTLAWLLAVCCALLAVALFVTAQLGKRLGFSREDRITILFCGSKKSLASGIPMANVLFSGSAVGAIVLPLMVFHQIQLMVCAVLAQRYARQAAATATAGSAA
ncbi:bile acid:sodium symporter family protein [Dokdonella sp.]|uniref:bile acid:sodium symporter family protein n=1 Tax=Dokdonella sp. TaxID=2291710 RepID=UPI002612BE1F|nr:bile acid:sodium symporter family protein [Dokdonella sp.]